MKRDKVYIVMATRGGDLSNHSYVAGVFNKKHAANKCADKETDDRGGKYTCQVIEWLINTEVREIIK